MPLLTVSCEAGLGTLYVGQVIGRRSYIRDEIGVLTDSAVTWKLLGPNGYDVDGNPAHEGVGTYLTTLPPFPASGVFHLVITSAGPVFDVEVFKFRVLAVPS